MRIKISILILVLGVSLSGLAVIDDSISPVTEMPADREIETPSGNEFDAACCKICKKGKACGDSCIKKSYNCTKPPGCACNG